MKLEKLKLSYMLYILQPWVTCDERNEVWLIIVILNEEMIVQIQTVKWRNTFQSKQEKISHCCSWLGTLLILTKMRTRNLLLMALRILPLIQRLEVNSTLNCRLTHKLFLRFSITFSMSGVSMVIMKTLIMQIILGCRDFVISLYTGNTIQK